MGLRTLRPDQPTLFDATDSVADKTSSTFADNLRLPVHRWFRYSAGFSATWVGETLLAAGKSDRVRVLDPFAGSGTVPVEAARRGYAAIGVEAHPFVARVARVKACNRVAVAEVRSYFRELLERAGAVSPDPTGYPELIRRCFPDETLADLDRLRGACREQADHPVGDFGWLALAAILRACSPVGTASWQYVLPNKTKARTAAPFEAFRAKAAQIVSDLTSAPVEARPARMLQEDARSLAGIADGWANLVITSPPYPNNFDYADATRLEMSFFGDIAGWSDLQAGVRKGLVRSCTQHVAPLVSETGALVAAPELATIRQELDDVRARLEIERASHGGKKNYHTMVAAYFLDLARVWRALRRAVAPGGRVCFVVGDSAPYGVHVPVERWLGELALAAGFRSWTFEKTRDRNIKWKNRKHRVPLQEGRLWVEA